MLDINKREEYILANPPKIGEFGYYKKMAEILGTAEENIRYICRKHNLQKIVNKQQSEKVIEEEKDPKEEIEEYISKIYEKVSERKRLEPIIEKHKKLKPEKWIQVFSDLHYGLKVNPLEVGDLGGYNPEIAKQRVQYLASTLCRILEYYPNRPEELYIALLGDNMEGAYMRGNQQANIKFGVCQQIIDIVEIFVDFIVILSRYFPTIKIFAVVGGNHGRPTKSKMDSPTSDNLEQLIYHYAKERLDKMEGISFEYTIAQHMIVEIAGFKFWTEHGDTVRSWTGIPFYGAKREKANINDMLAKFHEHADYMLIAHHHQKASFNEIFMNGSFPGGDIYSIGSLRRMDLPCQKLLGVNEKHGIIWERDVFLIDDPAKLRVKIYNQGSGNETC